MYIRSRLVSKISKGLLKLNSEKTNTPIKKWVKEQVPNLYRWQINM